MNEESDSRTQPNKPRFLHTQQARRRAVAAALASAGYTVWGKPLTLEGDKRAIMRVVLPAAQLARRAA